MNTPWTKIEDDFHTEHETKPTPKQAEEWLAQRFSMESAQVVGFANILLSGWDVYKGVTRGRATSWNKGEARTVGRSEATTTSEGRSVNHSVSINRSETIGVSRGTTRSESKGQ